MALVSLEDYNGNKIDINPDQVQFISTYQHYDHDLEVPEEMMHTNHDGNPEVHPGKREEVDKLRTSERTILTVGGASFVVKGTLAEVKKALGGPVLRDGSKDPPVEDKKPTGAR